MHAEERQLPKKTQSQAKHKAHGMNQSMDAGISDKYHYNSQGLATNLSAIKGP